MTHAALPHVGGVEVVVDNLGRALRERGHTVEHIAPDSLADDDAVLPHDADAGRAERVEATSVRASHIVKRLTGLEYPLVGLDFARKVRLASQRSDVVHAHTFLFLTSGLGLMLAARQARRSGRPARVLTDHGSRRIHDSRLMRGGERLAIATVGQAALRSAQVVIPINSRVAQEVEAIRPGKLGDLIPNGVDSELYRLPAPGERKLIRTARGWEERRVQMLFVGRVVPLKGADLAIEIARELGAEVELTLVGPGDPGPLPPNVTALGTLPPAEVAQLYRAADCLLLPSPAEGFPLVLQEAMASGLPAVIADNPGYELYLQDAPSGVIQVPRRQSSFVEALRAIEFGRAFSTADRDRLMEFAHERFSWACCATAYETLYRQLLGTP